MRCWFHKQYYPIPHHPSLITSGNIAQEQNQVDDTTTTTIMTVTKSQSEKSLNHNDIDDNDAKVQCESNYKRII